MVHLFYQIHSICMYLHVLSPRANFAVFVRAYLFNLELQISLKDCRRPLRVIIVRYDLIRGISQSVLLQIDSTESPIFYVEDIGIASFYDFSLDFGTVPTMSYFCFFSSIY